MSIYYIVVNKTKKEYYDLSDIGKNNSHTGYTLFFPQLLGYLVLEEYTSFNKGEKCDGDHEDGFLGHWNGDDIELVSEHDELYDIAQGLCDESDQWVNITIPLVKDWNKDIEEGFIEDESKKELTIDLSYLDKPKRVVDTGPRLDEAIKEAFKNLKG